MKLSNTMKTIKLVRFNTEVSKRFKSTEAFSDTRSVTASMVWSLFKQFVKGDKVKTYDELRFYMADNNYTSKQAMDATNFCFDNKELVAYVEDGGKEDTELVEALEAYEEYEDAFDTLSNYSIDTRREVEELVDKAEQFDEAEEVLDMLGDNSMTSCSELQEVIEKADQYDELSEKTESAYELASEVRTNLRYLTEKAEDAIQDMNSLVDKLEG